MMGTLDLIISLDILSFLAALSVFNLVDAFQCTYLFKHDWFVYDWLFNFANSASLDIMKSTNFSNPLFEELLCVESHLKLVNHSSATSLSDIWLADFCLNSFTVSQKSLGLSDSKEAIF